MKLFVKIMFSLLIFFIAVIIAIDILVIGNTKRKIYTNEELKDIKNVDAILVLGAGLKNNKPSLMLQERLDKAIELYEEKIADKIIVSGDHGQINYDEVNAMKSYLISHDVPSEDIYMDHAGFNTYDSMYRARYIFNVKKMIVVTQEYHLYRALYIASSLGIDSFGVDATKVIYHGQNFREFREVLARVKDFCLSMIKPKSTYVGEAIDLDLSGDYTNDYYIYISPILTGGPTYYVDKRDVYDKVLALTKKDKKIRKCDIDASYTLNLTNSNMYKLEIWGNIIHIVDGDYEITLSEEESKIIFSIMNR